MTERENDSERGKTKTSKLAIAAAILGIGSPAFFLLCLLTVLPASGRTMRLFIHDVAWLSALAGVVLGPVALVHVVKNARMLSGAKLAVAGTVVGTLFALGCFFDVVGSTYYDRDPGWSTSCGRHLSQLAKAMVVYANDDEYGRFPTPDKWCDLLLESGQVTEEHFICPKRVFFLPFMTKPILVLPLPRKGRCHYAMNPNVRGADSPFDMVVLFETTEGWNKSGGPELLSTERHYGDGCNIALVCTAVIFKPSVALDELIWTPEDAK